MIEINKIFKISLLVFIFFSTQVESKILSIGNSDAKVTIKVFSSLTCPHCAKLHDSIFNKLKNEYIDKGLVKFEHHPFPLDLAALNAEKILGCVASTESKLNLLNELYKKQDTWASGSDINSINQKIFKISNNYGLNNDKNNS